MNADFILAQKFTAQWEGGLTDHPSDPGGITNYGVSLRWLRSLGHEASLKPTAVASGSEQIAKGAGAGELASPRIGNSPVAGYDIDGDGDIDADDIRALTPDRAAELFKATFWDAYSLSSLPQLTATLHYDCMVNTGPKQATRIAQRACNSLVGPYGVKLDVDGILGPQTRAFLTLHATPALATAMIERRKGFYRDLVRDKPDFAPFERGWINRTNALQSYVSRWQ